MTMLGDLPVCLIIKDQKYSTSLVTIMRGNDGMRLKRVLSFSVCLLDVGRSR